MRVPFMLFVWYCFAISTVFQIFFTSVLVIQVYRKRFRRWMSFSRLALNTDTIPVRIIIILKTIPVIGDMQ